jgi:mannan endo-1,4-beta-mannosidase
VSYVLVYLGDGDPFPVALADQAYASGAELVVQFRPGMSMAQVAAGGDDAHLSSLIQQVQEFGHPVILSFAPEANGNWYQYGWTNTPPAQYRAAWSHLMSLATGVSDITWMLTLNRGYDGSAPLSDYLVPGVGLYGLDGYYASPGQSAGAGAGAGDTFDSVFGETLGQLRQLTSTPVMISETGIAPGYQPAAIPGLIQQARDNHLAGVIWLDADIDGGSWAMTPDGFAALRG